MTTKMIMAMVMMMMMMMMMVTIIIWGVQQGRDGAGLMGYHPKHRIH
jgi:hypothetical protein